MTNNTLDQFQIIRDKWIHEDNLINNRLNWLLVSQSMLFAAYGVFLTVPADSQWLAKVKTLIQWMPIFGVIMTILVSCSIYAALLAQRSLMTTQDASSLNGIYSVNTLSGVDWFGHAPAIILPLLMGFVWVVVWIA